MVVSVDYVGVLSCIVDVGSRVRASVHVRLPAHWRWSVVSLQRPQGRRGRFYRLVLVTAATSTSSSLHFDVAGIDGHSLRGQYSIHGVYRPESTVRPGRVSRQRKLLPVFVIFHWVTEIWRRSCVRRSYDLFRCVYCDVRNETMKQCCCLSRMAYPLSSME